MTQKRYSKVHLNAVMVIFFFQDIVVIGVVTSHKILFLCISTSSLSYTKNYF